MCPASGLAIVRLEPVVTENVLVRFCSERFLCFFRVYRVRFILMCRFSIP